MRPWELDAVLLDPSPGVHRTHMFRKLVSDGVNRVGVADVALMMVMLLICGSSERLQVNHTMLTCPC